MLIEVAVGACQRTLPLAVAVIPTMILPFVAHESIRMLLELLPDLGMPREVAIESGVGGEELRIVGERGITPELARDLRMLVQVAIVESSDLGVSSPRHRGNRAAAVSPFIMSFAIHELAWRSV